MTLLGAFIGAALAAWYKLRGGKPDPNHGDYDVLAIRVTELERRQSEMDARLDDVFDLMGSANKSLSACQVDIREALTRLQERGR